MLGYAHRVPRDHAHWARRVEEILAMRDAMCDPLARAHMLSIAATYQRLAELAENADIRPEMANLFAAYRRLLDHTEAG